MFFRHIELALQSGLRAKIGGVLARPSLERVLARFEPTRHNGAPLLGLRNVVVKSHGNANREAMGHAISEAIEEARRQVPQKIELMIQDYSIEGDT
jgi:glycerol-3-phosphate acyltransferase PlsX